LILVECVGGPLDGEIEVHEAQNFAFLRDPAWESGYYIGNPCDGKLYWVEGPFPIQEGGLLQ
jgi:hypothetical protein